MARTMDVRSLYSYIYHTYICSCSCICIFLSMHLTDSLWLQVGGPGPHPCSSWPRSIPIPIALSLSRLCRVIYMVCVTSYLFGLAKRFVPLLWDSTISFCQLQAVSLLCILLLLLLLLLTGGRSVSIVIELSFFYCHCIRSPIDSRCMTSDKVCWAASALPQIALTWPTDNWGVIEALCAVANVALNDRKFIFLSPSRCLILLCSIAIVFARFWPRGTGRHGSGRSSAKSLEAQASRLDRFFRECIWNAFSKGNFIRIQRLF